MIKYAFVDDDKEFCKLFTRLIDGLIDIRDIDFYDDAESFREVILLNKIQYDVIFLDIEMPKYDGITLSKQLFNHLTHSIIIFLTNRSELVYDAFGLNIFKFVSKSSIQNNLSNIIQETRNLINMRIVITLKCDTSDISLVQNDIEYIELIKRDIWIYTSSDKFRIPYYTLEKIYSTLNNSVFCFINRNTIVNMNYVKIIIGKKVFMLNNKQFDVSRGKKQSVLNTYKNSHSKILKL